MTLSAQCEMVAAKQRDTHRPTPCGYKPPLLSRLTRVPGQTGARSKGLRKFFGPAGVALLIAQGWLARNIGLFLPLRSGARPNGCPAKRSSEVLRPRPSWP